MHLPTIRPMTPADVEPIAAMFLRNDWGDRRRNLEFVTGHPETRPIVAEADGEVVGTGVASLHGPVAWIGTIFVEPAWRRRGVGMAITQAAIESAETAGCRTLVLVATEAGRPMYERLGFEVQTFYRILEAPGLPATTAVDPRVRAYRDDDLAAVMALDAAATGEDRGHLLRAFAAPDTTRVIDDVDGDGGVGGFVVRAPWGGGATIAARAGDALAVLTARRIAAGPGHPIRAGLLSENEAGLALLSADGWATSWQAPRLVRGHALRWQPDAIWGQFNHALG